MSTIKEDKAAEAKDVKKLSTLMPSIWQNMSFGWQSLRHSNKNSPQYTQLVMVFSKQHGENCAPNDCDVLALNNEDMMKAWVEHYARLLIVEFEWPNNELPEVLPTATPSQCVYDSHPPTTHHDETRRGCWPI